MPNADYVPVIIDLDPETGESTGTVHPFCSEECRASYIPENLPHVAYEPNTLSDWDEATVCEQCGTQIDSSGSED